MEAGITTPGFDEQIRKLKGEKQKLLQEMQKLEDSNTEFCQKVNVFFGCKYACMLFSQGC